MSNHSKLGFGLILAVLLFQIYVRYVPWPWAVFVADDWTNWARSSFYVSGADAALTGLTDPNRPLSMMAVEVVFRWFGNNPVPWTVLSIFANSLVLIGVMRMGWWLTGRPEAAVMAGVVFVLLPNLTETVHWSTQVLNEMACAVVFYVWSGWMAVAYARTGRGWRLAVSALAYGVGVFSYEAGLLLPASYAVIFWWFRGLRAPVPAGPAARCVPVLRAMAPFAGVALVYLAWRVSDAFGLNITWGYPPHMKVESPLAGLFWNIRQLVHWWVGDRFFGSVLNGLNSFAGLTPWLRRLLVVGNILVLAAWGRWLVCRARAPRPVEAAGHHPVPPVWLFPLAWFVAAASISLISYTAPRLNVLPAVGVSLLAGGLLSMRPVRTWGPWLFVPALMALMANQGTSESYREAGLLHMRLFNQLERHRDQWMDKEAVILDTHALRQRLTPGLVRPVDMNPSAWAEYRNALLVRGFVPLGMVQRITGERRPSIRVLHDVENGVRLVNEDVVWHERYDPDRARIVPRSRVWIIDLHEASLHE